MHGQNHIKQIFTLNAYYQFSLKSASDSRSDAY